MSDSLSQALSQSVTTVADPAVIATFTRDWTGRFIGHADLVVRPESTEQVAAVVRTCHKHDAQIQIQGGNTGLVGGSVPAPKSDKPICLISTQSLNAMNGFDEITGHITVGAGMTLSHLQKLVRAKGWDFAVDLAARESATVGGLVATNAGGIRVCAFGMTRRSVAGIEMVLANGNVLSNLASPLKDNTGYAIADMAIGAEGTIGIITAVKLKLIRPISETTLFLIPTDSMRQALEILETVQKSGNQLLAAEYIDATSMQTIFNYVDLRPLWNHQPTVTLLLEVAGNEVELDLPADSLGSSEPAGKRAYWQYREAASDAWTALGNVHKLDVSVAVSDLAKFELELTELLSARHDVTNFGSFGHLADGNLHIEIFGPDADDYEIDKAVLQLVAKYRGSISAEHGIGRAKREYLQLTRNQIDIDYMIEIKALFDPTGIFNPGVLLPD